MKTYTYPAVFEPGREEAIVVSFPDVPEAVTEGDDLAEARAMAADALGLALLSYFISKQPLPMPGPTGEGETAITAEYQPRSRFWKRSRNPGFPKRNSAFD